MEGISSELFQTLEPRRMFSAGDLDVSFAGDGRSVIDLPGSTNEIANATVVQDDGKVVVVGRASVGAETDFFVARLLANGAIDTSFGGGDGLITIDFAVNDEATDVALQPDGKIVIVGTSSSGVGSNARDFAVARLNDNGSLDATFSGDGKTTVDYGTNDDAQAVAIAGSLIYIGGYKDLGTTGHFALARLLSNGAPDTSYSTDGEVFFGFGGNNDSRCYDIAIDTLDHVVMVGYDEVIGGSNGRNFAYARVGPNALLDPVFSGDGLAVTDFSSGDDEARAVGIDPRGNIVVGGFSDGAGGDDFTATRLTRAGALDNSFNGDGAFRMNIGGVEAVDDLVIHPDGDITLSGQTSVGSFQAALVRLSLGAGTPSASFGDGGDGVQLINFGAIDDGFAVALDQRSLSVVTAGADGSGKLAIARVHDLNDRNFANATGNTNRMRRHPDGGFIVLGGTTLKRISLAGVEDATFLSAPAGIVRDFEIDSLGRIVTIETVNIGSDNEFIRVKRLLPTGALDNLFSGDGVLEFTYTNSSQTGSFACGIAIDSSNRIVIAGVEGDYVSVIRRGDSAVARITTSGVLDSTFDGDGINVLNNSDLDDVNAVAIAPDGKIVIAGSDSSRVQVFRITSNGSRDNSFGLLGVQKWGFGVTAFTNTRDVAVDSAGRVIVAGYNYLGNGADGSDSFVSRLTADGDLDDTFDGDGSILLNLAPGSYDFTDSVAIDGNGRIVLVGTNSFSQSTSQTIVRRLIPGAAVVGDNTFASDGVWVDSQSAEDAQLIFRTQDVLIDGAIYVAGGHDGIRRLNVDPAIVDFEFLFETAPQRLRVKFNDDVGDSITNFDLVIRNTTANVQLNPATYSLASYDPLTNTATLNFNGILADGNYTATFSDTGIENRQLMNLGGDRVKEFFFLAGDFNHDGRVNLADFNILAGSFGQSNRTFSQGDANYDGVANLIDFNILAGKFGTSLVP